MNQDIITIIIICDAKIHVQKLGLPPVEPPGGDSGYSDRVFEDLFDEAEPVPGRNQQKSCILLGFNQQTWGCNGDIMALMKQKGQVG